MRELSILIAHLLTTLVKLAQPGRARAVAAESMALKHQVPILQRNRKRAPSLTPWDRLFFGLCSLWLPPNRRRKISIVRRPSSFQRLHETLARCKYRLLYTAKRPGRWVRLNIKQSGLFQTPISA